MFRIIPKLDIKGSNVVKGINLEGLRILGDPNYFISQYYDDGADEIFIQDVVASLYDNYSLLSIIKSISKKCFIPITVGGGIKSLDEITLLLTNGADRISINSYAFSNINFISNVAKKFGSSTLSINIQVMKIDDKYITYYNNGRTPSGIEILEWIKSIQNEGVGEIVLTSISKEGLMRGFDLELIEKIRQFVNVPLLMNGGASTLDDIANLKLDYDLSGVVLSSIIHYNFFHNEISDKTKINSKIKDNLPKLKTYKINEIKKYLIDKNIEVRS